MRYRHSLEKIVFIITGLSLVIAVCGCGGSSGSDNSVSDTIAPSTPSGLVSRAVTTSQINLSWVGSVDNIAVTGYKVYRGGAFLTTVTGTTMADTDLLSNTSYCYAVSAIDVAMNESNKSTQSCAITLDGGIPSIPTGLTVSSRSATRIGLFWNESTDNSAVTAYNIYRNDTVISKVSSTSILDTGLTPSTAYCYAVSALDAANNESQKSAQACSSTVIRLPDTGQTQSYTATFGEDNDYTKHTLSYIDNGDGTITDDVTGLMWQKHDDGILRTWSIASSDCTSTNLGGHADWRLPTDSELMTIVHYGANNPAIDTVYFSQTYTTAYWTSTTDADTTAYAWFFDFASGGANGRPKIDTSNMRCVRESMVSWGAFADNGDGTITDIKTGLMFQKQDDGVSKTWESAIAYCESLALGGYTDWRLPNIKELRSNNDSSIYRPSVNLTFFPGTQVAGYWSSTTFASSISDAWYINFDFGVPGGSGKTNNAFVRCVRYGN